MKKMTSKNEKLRLIACISLTVVVFAAALLLPLAFRTAVPTGNGGAEMSLNQRIKLFHYYWDGKDGAEITEVAGADNLTNLQRTTVRMTYEKIANTALFDLQSILMEDEGLRYFTVKRGEQEITLCRFWVQGSGDWRNWLDVCFDADTGYVYYLYLSSENLTNPGAYSNILPAKLDTEQVAYAAAEFAGAEVNSVIWSRYSGDAAEAEYAFGGEKVNVSVSCIYYSTSLVDIKIISG